MILSVGEVLVDIFVDKENKQVFPGGAPFNVACNIAHFNNKEAAFYGAVGNDKYGGFLGDFAQKKLNHLYLDTLDFNHTTEAIVTLNDGERSFRFNRDNGADYHLNLNTLKKIDLANINIVHIGSLMLSFKEGREFFKEAVSYIRGYKHIKISFDVNYRDDIFSSENEAKKIFIAAINDSDVIKFTSEELELLTGEVDIKKSLDKLLNEKQVAVVTLGKEGSIYYSKNRFVKVSSYPLKSIDTTGAGDAFYSYFLYELDKHPELDNDESLIKEVLKRANVVGALATQKKGAIDVAPSLKEIDDFLAKHN